MSHSRFRHHTGLLKALLPALVLMAAVSACDCECCDCDDPGGDNGWIWYRTKVEAKYDREWYIPVTPRHDWTAEWPADMGITPKDLEHPMPEGLRVVTFASDGDVRSYNMEPQGGDVPMTQFTTNLLFYNNDTEFIVIDNPENFAEATATTRARNPGVYSGNPAVGTHAGSETVRSQPDMLFRAALSEQQTDSTVSEIVDSPKETHIIPVTLSPAVYTYAIHFNFDKGFEYVLSGGAAMTGMASGVRLCTGRTLEEPCTIMFDLHKTENGLTGVMMSFGAPGYRDGDELYEPKGRYGITLQLVLTNGKHISYSTEVTAQMSSQPAGGVVIVGGIEVSEEDAKPEGGGAFDVEVDPWGEPSDFEIIL